MLPYIAYMDPMGYGIHIHALCAWTVQTSSGSLKPIRPILSITCHLVWVKPWFRGISVAFNLSNVNVPEQKIPRHSLGRGGRQPRKASRVLVLWKMDWSNWEDLEETWGNHGFYQQLWILGPLHVFFKHFFTIMIWSILDNPARK